jgi:hypothetical protein
LISSFADTIRRVVAVLEAALATFFVTLATAITLGM